MACTPSTRRPLNVPGSLVDLRTGAIFYRMGFDDRDIVALSGAHALGRCHEEASGYWGPWTFAETTFSNEYFRLLLEETWTLKTTHNGRKWKGPDQCVATWRSNFRRPRHRRYVHAGSRTRPASS